MNLIEGTNVGQVNLPQSAENSNSVGSTFAAVNPPMSAKALAISLAEVPRPWHPAAVQKVATDATVSGSDLMAELTGEKPHQHTGGVSELWRDKPICGVVTIQNESWTPKGTQACPPSVTNKLGMFLSAQWVMFFNGSSEARRRHHWAVLTTRGTALILTGIGLKDRPINPSDFPSCVVSGLTPASAEQVMANANSPRCEFARVPRLWTVAVRRADSVESEVVV